MQVESDSYPFIIVCLFVEFYLRRFYPVYFQAKVQSKALSASLTLGFHPKFYVYIPTLKF